MSGFLFGRSRARVRLRLLALVLGLLGVQLGTQLVAPAYACGCGAMVPDERQRVRVDREESVVRWDGRQEQIVMRLTVSGDARRAAWIMPVPHRATVRLGDPGLFEELADATAPVHRDRHYFWPRHGDWPFVEDGDLAGAPPSAEGAAPGVGVVGRQRLGPFDVARLTATDPDALDGWLRENGFTFPDRLREALRPYVRMRWEYVAVRLAPETTAGAPTDTASGTPSSPAPDTASGAPSGTPSPAAGPSGTGSALTGALDPLHLTFAAEEPVYPMRLSRLAATPQSLGLYVLADHRMEPRSRIGGERPQVTFAGRIWTADAGPLARLAQGTPYLTALAQEFPEPSRISGDHELTRAATDTPYQEVVYEDRLLTVAGVPAWLLTVGGALTAAGAVAVLAIRSRRRPRPGRPVETPGA
ncbi:DUF2330 domain-containing protein [Streptomyces sp. enrichment culture]|uniref:DUF2330 domain-containing protein n=1 Tax=Streptomyces sp. enrichment culture TaxID=1795815 RepID=UPI003F5482B1